MIMKSNTKLVFPQQSYDGLGLAPDVLTDIFDYLQDGDVQKVVEFGSGSSTGFLLSCRHTYDLEFSLDSFDHSTEYCFKSPSSHDNFNLMIRDLVQYTDEEYLEILNSSNIPTGSLFSKENYGDWRAKNVFYAIEEGDLANCYDLVVLDGPNGNGRSVAFRYLVDRVRTGTKIVIDDYHHYPFVESCKKILNVKLLKKINKPDFHPLHGYAVLEVI